MSICSRTCAPSTSSHCQLQMHTQQRRQCGERHKLAATQLLQGSRPAMNLAPEHHAVPAIASLLNAWFYLQACFVYMPWERSCHFLQLHCTSMLAASSTADNIKRSPLSPRHGLVRVIVLGLHDMQAVHASRAGVSAGRRAEAAAATSVRPAARHTLPAAAVTVRPQGAASICSQQQRCSQQQPVLHHLHGSHTANSRRGGFVSCQQLGNQNASQPGLDAMHTASPSIHSGHAVPNSLLSWLHSTTQAIAPRPATVSFLARR